MKFLNENIVRKIEEIVQKNNFLVIDFLVRGNKNNPIFEVYIDGLKGVTTDDCVIVSREIEEMLEKEDSVSEHYRLDVSSPGVGRPLKYVEQYPQNIGRKFELKFQVNADIKKVNAQLLSVDNNKLSFRTDSNEEFLVDFDNIVTAKVIISI